MSILAFAYGCEPHKGSEPGAGWNWARGLAHFDHVYVITRANNADVIERSLPGIPERDRLSFVYVDLPKWASFWKKGRGHRVYYFLWQVAALKTAKRMREQQGFEIVWHLTWANFWMGAMAAFAGGRFVLGPVGGGVAAPLKLTRVLGLRGAVFELARWIVVALARYLNPFARVSWRRAELVLVQNPETQAWMPRRHRHKAVVFPNALLAVPGAEAPVRSRGKDLPPTMLYAGRLLPWKGVYLAIEALEFLPEWRLVICGSGYDKARLRRLVERGNLQDRVEFRGWVEREELGRIMLGEADVFVFPSLHEDAGFAVAEATAAGLPSVCLDRGGPRLLGGIPVEAGSPRATAEALAGAIAAARGFQPSPLPTRSQQLSGLRTILADRGLLPGVVSAVQQTSGSAPGETGGGR